MVGVFGIVLLRRVGSWRRVGRGAKVWGKVSSWREVVVWWDGMRKGNQERGGDGGRSVGRGRGRVWRSVGGWRVGPRRQ